MTETHKFNHAGQATLKLDLYNMEGEEFKPKPNWHCYMSGDMSGEEGLEKLDLAATTFPTGTRVTIEFPLCPSCDQEEELCECGFDWGKHWGDEFA